jgi:O-antigen ligase
MSSRTEPITIRIAGPALINAPPAVAPPGWIDMLLLYGLFGLIAFAIVSFGAIEPWSIFLFESGALLLFVLWTFKHLATRRLSLPWNPLYPAFAIIAAVVALQLGFGWTAYGEATLQHALKYLAYVFLVIVANDCLRHITLAHRLGTLLAFFGFALACVSLAQDSTHSSQLLFIGPPAGSGWSYGPYADHNHYAGVMDMLAAFPLTLAMAPYLSGRLRALLGTAAAVMVATIFLSGSRIGMIAFFAQAAFLALVFARGRQHRRKVAIAAVFVFIFLAALFAFGKGFTLHRWASLRDVIETQTAGPRILLLKDSRAMLLERPAMGWGLGTFQYVYPQFRSFYTNDVIEHAHNDYLELLLETGFVGFAGVLWFVFVLLWTGWKKLPHWKTNLTGAIKIAAMAACVAVLVQASLDFNLQIAGIAALFFVLSTMVVGKLREEVG